MSIDRRTTLSGLAAGILGLLLPPRVRAQGGGTLEQVKQRGTLRVGVTQAPPWYSKDPKTGQWSSGVGVSLGKISQAVGCLEMMTRKKANIGAADRAFDDLLGQLFSALAPVAVPKVKAA